MPSAVAILLQIFNSPLSRRLMRVLLWGLPVLWLFDHILLLLTDYQWFASIGYQDLLLRRWTLQAGIFGSFFTACLALTVAVMRTVLRPAGKEEPQPLGRTLRRLEPLRARALRWSWCLLLIWAALLARALSRQWFDWLEFRDGTSLSFRVPFYGLDAGFWVHQLPFLEHVLSAVWRFSLLLFLLAVAAGTLRSLSLVASRYPVTPVRFNRTLVALTVWLLILRALGFGLAAFSVARTRYDAAGLFLARPLDIIGATACFMLAIMAMTHHKATPGNFWWPGWKFINRVVAVLLLPPLLDLCLTPFWNHLAPPGAMDAARTAASIKAWHLDLPAYVPEKPLLPEEVWPVWDEDHILQAIRNRRAANKLIQTVEIQAPASANDQWEAIVAGPAPSDTVVSSSRAADENALVIAKTTLPSNQDEVNTPDPLTMSGLALYGYEGRTLIGEDTDKSPLKEDVGVNVRSWASKLAWSWRLRDAFLTGEAAKARSIIVFRGAEECARRIAPSLIPEGPPHLQIVDRRPYWVLNLLAASNNFPGAYQPETGNLSDVNAAQYAGTMLMDAQSGRIWVSAAGPAAALAASLSPDLPIQIHNNFQPSLREAQARILAKITHSDLLSASMPLRMEPGLERAIVLAGKGRGHLLMERPVGLTSQMSIWPISSDVQERSRALNKAMNDLIDNRKDRPSADGMKLELGSPIVWPDAFAPGGWWIGQATYLVPDPTNISTPDNRERLTHLRSIAIAGATGNPGAGTSWRDAITEWQAKQAVVPLPSDTQVSTQQLAATALHLHESALKEFFKSNYEKAGRLFEAEGKILKQLAGRK